MKEQICVEAHGAEQLSIWVNASGLCVKNDKTGGYFGVDWETLDRARDAANGGEPFKSYTRCPPCAPGEKDGN